ncbi:MAG: CHAT domain-containing tetratricopeptide repeat protein [Pyrinomonadaceae bacterium]
MRRPYNISAFFCACLLTAATGALVLTANTARGQSPSTPLVLGQSVNGRLAGGETQLFPVELIAGQFVRVVVEQQGIDVAVALIGPEHQRLIEMDSPNGNFGPEPISAIAAGPGTYLIEVRSPDARAAAGDFEIKVEALREPTATDRSRVEGEQGFRSASKLLQQPATRQEALVQLEALLPIFHSLPDPFLEISVLNRLGLAYNALGQPQLALARFDRALELSQSINDQRNQARMLNNLGGAYDVLGEPQPALLHYNQALALWGTLNNDVARGDTLNNIGVIYYNLGDLQLSLDFLSRALPLRRQGSNWRREADTLDNLSLVYVALGEPPQALEFLTGALQLRRIAKDVQGEANTLNQIGFAYASSGETATALNYFNQALPLRRTSGDRRGEAVTLKNIGAAYTSLGQPQDAIGQLQLALELARTTHSRREEGIILVYLGQAQLLAGNAAQAIEFYTQALGIFLELTDRLDEARARQGLAEAQLASNNFIQAREQADAAINIVETMRGRVTSQQLRTSFFASRQDAYELMIDLLMRMHQAEPRKGYDAAALKVSERARARSLLDMLAEFGVDVRQGADLKLLDRERELAQILNTKATRLITLKGQSDRADQIQKLQQEIGALEADYQQVRGDIRRLSPHYAAVTQPQALDLAELQKQLDPDTLLLEYSLGTKRSYLWVVTRNGLTSYQLAGRDQIEMSARRLYELVTARAQRKEKESPAQKRVRIDQADRDAQTAAEQLSGLLVGPAAAELENKRLAIVADGALQYIPFSMLSVPAAAERSVIAGRPENSLARQTYRPLFVDHEIVSLPSASILALQRNELAGRQPAPNNIALLADPVFDRSDARVRSQPGRSEAPPTGTIARTDGTRTLEHLSDEDAQIRRLPFTRQEAQRILAVAPKSSNFEALDFKANLAAATDGELSKYRYVHFATHGYIDSERPGLSALVLSLVNERGEPREGLLKTQEIYNLNLPAELVVLSACQTGLGKVIKGEGVVGLTRGFMYAGAARIIVSMWNVSDKGTAELMARLYQGMITGGMRPTAAFREAQLALWRQKQWRSPYYWAAFVQQGEWR